ncbi:MAG: hypothetical protein V4795_12595 [Pseudomonadota bacterium]
MLRAGHLLAGGHQMAELPPQVLHQVLRLVELLRSIAAEPLHLVDRCGWPGRAAAGCRAAGRGHPAELLGGLRRAELLPLALHLVDGGGVELLGVAVHPLVVAAEPVHFSGGACRTELHLAELLRGVRRAGLLPQALHLVGGGGVEVLARATRRASCCTW